MRRLYITIAILVCATGLYAQGTEEIVANIDSYAAKVRKEWRIPGFSLTVVKDGDVVLSKGYGVKERGQKAPVDENTVYQIGSVSKSFTAALMAIMVDEGKVSWTDKVKDILPGFELVDKDIEDVVEVRDLMTHKLGFKGQAGTYLPNVGYSRDDVAKMMSRVQPAYGFREGLHYNNMTFLWALQIIEKVSGMSWEENLRTRIFEPLGMTTASCNKEGFLASENRAEQHDYSRGKDSARVAVLKGESRALHWLTVVGPAGGINCSAADLAKWAEFHRQMGVAPDGQRLISYKQMQYLHKGYSISSQTDNMIKLYGHCWYVEQNEKYRVYYHTGTVWGHSALCVFMPSQNLSIAMLFDAEVPNGPRFAIMRRVIDLYRGEPDIDYSTNEYRKWINGSGGGSGNGTGWTIKYTSATPSASSLVGHYTKDELFGDANVYISDGKLYIKVGKEGWKHRLVHTKGNKYQFTSDGHTFPVIFRIDPSTGKANAFEINWGCGERLGAWNRQK